MRTHENEIFTLTRDVQAVMVPAGTSIELKAGLSGFITQALGGSFTLYIEGNLYRLSGENADAIGKESSAPPALPENATNDDVRDAAWQQMRNCYDPEIPINIVELGLVYRCDVVADAEGQRTVSIDMTLTAPGCGMGDVLVEDVRDKVERIPTVVKAEVQLTFDPPWNQSMMSEAARLQTGMM